MSKAKILLKNTFWIYLNKLVAEVLQVVVTILIIRKLSVDDFGSFNFLVANVMIFSLCGTSAVCTVFNRYIPELFEKKAKRELIALINYGAIVSVAVVGLICVLFYIFKGPLSDFLHMKAMETYAMMFVIYLMFSLLNSLMNSVLASLLLHKILAHVNIAKSLLRTLAYLISLPWLSLETMLFIEIGSVIITLTAGIIVYLWYKAKVIDKFDGKDNIEFQWRRTIRLGLFSSVNEIGAGVVGKMSDYYIISAMSNAYFTGLYSFAFRIFNMTQQALPMKDFLSVLRPVFFQKFTQPHDKEDFIQVYNFIVKFMLAVYCLPVLYIWLFGKPVINIIFDPKYIDAYIVTCIIIFSNVIVAVFYPVGLTMLLIEKMEYALYSKIVVVFSIVGGILAMKYYGILGVVLVTATCDLLKNTIMFLFVRRIA
ncbi:MAG: oligosaccharide flippase family protein, partial [Victivallales bacterium]